MSVCPEDGSEDCLACSGEACDFCGAGCWNNDPDLPLCEHDVVDRHDYLGKRAAAYRAMREGGSR